MEKILTPFVTTLLLQQLFLKLMFFVNYFYKKKHMGYV